MNGIDLLGLERDIIDACDNDEDELKRFFNFLLDKQTVEERCLGDSLERNGEGLNKVEARSVHGGTHDMRSIVSQHRAQLARAIAKKELEAPVAIQRLTPKEAFKRITQKWTRREKKKKRFVLSSDDEGEDDTEDDGDADTARVVCALGICDYTSKSKKSSSVVLFNWRTLTMIDDIFRTGRGESFRTLCDRVNLNISWSTHHLTDDEIDMALYTCRGKEIPRRGAKDIFIFFISFCR